MGLELLYKNLQHPRVCPNPIFVIGVPRSGSHGLAFSLGQHSHLWTHGESRLLFELFRDDPVQAMLEHMRQDVFPDFLKMFGVGREEILAHLGLGVNALFTSRSSGKRWIDKTPDYTLIAPLLADMFPTAQFLHILRDGRRVVNSMIHFLDKFGQSPETVQAGVPPWTRDFRVACQTWREYMRAGLDFAERYPERCLTVVNEQLVADAQAGFARILEFLGEPFEAGCVLFFRGFRIHSSYSQQSADLSALTSFSKPVSEWTMEDLKVFLEPVPYQDTQPWEDWTDEQRRVFAEEAGALMVRCGFASADELGSWGELKEWAAPAPPPSPANTIPEEVRQVVATVLPPEAVVTAVEPEGEKLLKLTGPESWQFPRTEGGRAADSLPADTGVAIANLKVLGAGGAAFLVVPHTAFGWLEGAEELQRHLTAHYDCYWKDERCVIYRLALPPKPASPARTWRAVKV